MRIPGDEFGKIEKACLAFGCTPYIAIVVDAGGTIRVFITAMAHLLQLFPPSAAGSGWKMSEAQLARYAHDAEVMTFEMKTETKRWWA